MAIYDLAMIAQPFSYRATDADTIQFVFYNYRHYTANHRPGTIGPTAMHHKASR